MPGIIEEIKNNAAHLFYNLAHLGRFHEHDFSPHRTSQPVVFFVPGFSLSSFHTCSLAKKKLEEIGCRAFAFNAGINTRDICRTAERLSAFVEEVCQKCQIEKIFILAHSMGGLISEAYSLNFNGCRRIKKIIAVATPFTGTRLAWLACPVKAARQMLPGSSFLRQLESCPRNPKNIVSIYPKRDQVIKPKFSSILAGAKNIEVPVVGHITVMRSPETWEIIKKELGLA